MKVEMINIEDVKTAAFNPALRTSENRLYDLKKAIEESGEIYPIQIGKDGILGDGHRRLACAKALGWELIPAIRSKTRTSVEIYLANDGRVSRSTKGAEWFQAVEQGFPLDMVPAGSRNYIAYLYKILKSTEIKSMVKSGQSPTIANFTRRVMDHIGSDDPDMARKVCIWLYKHGIQYPVRKALEDGCPPETVIAAIEADRPIIREYK